MSRRIIAWVVCLGLAAFVTARPVPAEASAESPSVLVTLTRLKEGTLAHVVITYGTVQASNSGGKALMAPESAVVGAVYVRLGQPVRSGAALVQLLPSPQTAAAYQQAKSALAVAAALVKSTRKLFALHLATAEQLAQAEKSQVDARASLQALRAAGAAGPDVLRAPFTAVVTALSAQSGSIVSEGAPLLNLAAPNRLVLAAGVVPAQAMSVRAGDSARVKAAGSDHWVRARVAMRGAASAANTGLVPVQITLPPGAFMPGEIAEARISTAEVRGYVVPHEAVLVNDSGAPYVVQAVNGTAHKVAVKVLDAEGRRDVISGALDPHAPLVLSGNYQLDNGMKVRLAKSGGEGAQ